MVLIDKKIKVFISSTIYDLKDVRGGVKSILEREFGVMVYGSEFKDFPIKIDKHSYETCISRLKECDLIVCIIDKRYGGIYEIEDGEKISITRKEIQEGMKAGIDVITFVRDITWKERYEFKMFKKDKLNFGKNLKELFEEFKSKLGEKHTEDYEVFDFIDEIAYANLSPNEKSNWIFQFDSTYDLIDILRNQLKTYFLEKDELNLSFIPSIITKIPKDIERLITKSSKYAEQNLFAIHLPKILNKHAGKLPFNTLFLLKKNFDEVLSVYVNDMVSQIGIVGENTKTKIYVSDRSMEFINPIVWKKDKNHKKVFNFSSTIAKKYGFQNITYVRIMILSNPTNLLTNSQWINALDYYIKYHQENKIKVGIIWDSYINPPLGESFLNYYLIPNKLLALFDVESGIALEITKNDDSGTVTEFTDFYEELSKNCDLNNGGFWIENKSTSEVINEISSLIE